MRENTFVLSIDGAYVSNVISPSSLVVIFHGQSSSNSILYWLWDFGEICFLATVPHL